MEQSFMRSATDDAHHRPRLDRDAGVHGDNRCAVLFAGPPMTRIWQFNATLLTAALLFGAYHYGLLESLVAIVALCFASGLILKRVFG
jgi:hypothetical protein